VYPLTHSSEDTLLKLFATIVHECSLVRKQFQQGVFQRVHYGDTQVRARSIPLLFRIIVLFITIQIALKY
jgi:hypothetical protein